MADGDELSTDRESAAFEAELAPLLGQALRLAGSLLLDRTAAEDAVQEAALRAWRRRGNRREGSALRPWFLAIVVNQCRDVRRGRWFGLRLFTHPAEETTGADDLDAVLDLRRAVTALTPSTRLVVVLRYYLDLPIDEVAAITGDSPEATRSRIRRGLRSLHTDLANLDEESL